MSRTSQPSAIVVFFLVPKVPDFDKAPPRHHDARFLLDPSPSCRDRDREVEATLWSGDTPEKRDLSSELSGRHTDPGFTDIAALSPMLKPYDAGSMRSYPVSNRINQGLNDDLACALPMETMETQERLF